MMRDLSGAAGSLSTFDQFASSLIAGVQAHHAVFPMGIERFAGPSGGEVPGRFLRQSTPAGAGSVISMGVTPAIERRRTASIA
jgi:hypothetical protein